MSVAALILAAGKGVRAGSETPKQFREIGGKTLLAHAVDALAAHPGIAAVYVAVGDGHTDAVAEALAGRCYTTVPGGAERQDSVYSGLEAIAADAHRSVLIHDAARPFVPACVIDRLLASLEMHDGTTPVLPVTDTLARGEGTLGDVVPREGLNRIQTPQAFRLDAIMTSHAQWQGPAATDDAQMLRAAGFSVALVEGDAMLEKITHPADFARAEALHGAKLVSRTGLGFDVHRLEAGYELWLCGVKLDHARGLAGHSDADVALHALTDALLGAVGEGDIGDHFPPSDPQWKGAPSRRFVEHARDLISAKGGVIDHVDVTIICEAPRIGPHRAAMREAVASMLRLPVQRVSVKATTTERLGLTGRGEGIAAQAVATIRSPV
jgi:2-C-methyl-D-erythritol 4-phosphate cytidylyltransferase / 2-C-methyl-D-erythritol 2,4-cyclodiphosphate synthase